MPTPAAQSVHTARRALLTFDRTELLSLVDELDLRPGAGLNAAIGVPLKNLQKGRDLERFATLAPPAAVSALLQLVCGHALNAVVDELGDNSANPTHDELETALRAVRARDVTRDQALAVLVIAIVDAFPAAAHCQAIIDSDPDYALAELPESAPVSRITTTKSVDPAVKEQRQRRREEQKAKKKPVPAPVPPRRSRAVTPPAAPVVSAEPAASPLPPEEWRSVRLTPRESERFVSAPPAAGTIVLADVAFDDVDPLVPDQTSKERPALVVAASGDAVLVRPIYSLDGPGRMLFGPWRRAGLNKACYVSDDRIVVEAPLHTLTRVGNLTVSEWNALQ